MPFLAGIISIIGFIFLFFLALIGFIILFIRGGFKAAGFETRFRQAYAKYKNDELARMIARGELWTGQTSDQLRDALGEPESIYSIDGDDTVWQYANGRRVILREDHVVSWQ